MGGPATHIRVAHLGPAGSVVGRRESLSLSLGSVGLPGKPQTNLIVRQRRARER